MKKGFGLVGVLIIIGVIAVGGGGYYYSQKTNDLKIVDNEVSNIPNTIEKSEENKQVIKKEELAEDNDWKTYRNEDYGFEFKYPKEWKVEITENDKSTASLVYIKYNTGQTWGVDKDEFTAQVSCFSNINRPFLSESSKKTSESLNINNTTIPVYIGPAGMDSQYMASIMKDNLEGKVTNSFLYSATNIGCGIFFHSWNELTGKKKDIIESFSFVNDIDVFVNSVKKHFEDNPPTKG